MLNLTNLDISFNQLKGLSKNHLKGLTKLMNIDFDSNKLEKINRYTFNELTNLTTLNLSGNKIKELEDLAPLVKFKKLIRIFFRD